MELDPLWLGRILANLIDNACKFTPAGGRVEVRVGQEGGRARVVVEDTAPPLAARERERVFERFYRGSDAKKLAPGTGVGLSIVKKAAEAQQGHVWVISAEEQGTTFFLSMPKLEGRGTRPWNLG